MILKKKQQAEKQLAKKQQTSKQQVEKYNLFNSVPAKFEKYFELIRSGKELDYRHLRYLFRGLFCRQRF
jgi:hypothetical protein